MKKIGLFLVLYFLVMSVKSQDDKYYQPDNKKKESPTDSNYYYQPKKDSLSVDNYYFNIKPVVKVPIVPKYNIYRNGNVSNQPTITNYYH